MTKGFILNVFKLDNGFLIILFRLFRIGFLIDNEELGKYNTLLLGIWRFEITLSLIWRKKLHGNEENTTQNQQKPKAPVASA